MQKCESTIPEMYKYAFPSNYRWYFLIQHDAPLMSCKTQILKVNVLMAVNVIHNTLARCTKSTGSLQINDTGNW